MFCNIEEYDIWKQYHQRRRTNFLGELVAIRLHQDSVNVMRKGQLSVTYHMLGHLSMIKTCNIIPHQNKEMVPVKVHCHMVIVCHKHNVTNSIFLTTLRTLKGYSSGRQCKTYYKRREKYLPLSVENAIS